VQDNAKKRAIHLQPTVVLDEAQLSEFVHEFTRERVVLTISARVS